MKKVSRVVSIHTSALVVICVYSDTNLASPLLEFDLDEQNEANQRHNHEESQEDAHVKIFCGLLWKRRSTETQICQIIFTCSWLKRGYTKRVIWPENSPFTDSWGYLIITSCSAHQSNDVTHSTLHYGKKNESFTHNSTVLSWINTCCLVMQVNSSQPQNNSIIVPIHDSVSVIYSGKCYISYIKETISAEYSGTVQSVNQVLD